MLFQLAFAESESREPDPLPAKVRAAMFTGAMAELAQQYLAGNLGDDLDRVVDEVVETLLPSRRASA